MWRVRLVDKMTPMRLRIESFWTKKGVIFASTHKCPKNFFSHEGVEEKNTTPLKEKSETFPLMLKFIPFSVSAEQMERLVYGEHKLKILLMQWQKKSTSA